jgi:hypothetical protein
MATAFPWFSGGETICPNVTCGAHITLRCKNHPDLRWSTKNIGYIGGRSIFFSSNWGAKDVSDYKQECECKISDLYHDHADDKGV